MNTQIIDNVVIDFYEIAKNDFLIGYHFRHIKNFDTHIPKIQRFWYLSLLNLSGEQKKEIIALNKIEIADQKRVEKIKKEFESSLNQEVKLISAATGHQLDQLTNLCLEYLQDE